MQKIIDNIGDAIGTSIYAQSRDYWAELKVEYTRAHHAQYRENYKLEYQELTDSDHADSKYFKNNLTEDPMPVEDFIYTSKNNDALNEYDSRVEKHTAMVQCAADISGLAIKIKAEPSYRIIAQPS